MILGHFPVSATRDSAPTPSAMLGNPGLPYFAWIDPLETIFAPEHLRWDENIFSFTLNQDEGDPASLTLVVRRPRNVAGDPIGLLGPGRKVWCWFALDCGPDLIRFRGRLVGVPTSIFEELVTLEFVARPLDLVAQKAALADTLRVLPYYDELVIDPQQRNDPEVVLEGYSKIWHYDRETHVLTVSDEITGEDGLVEFDGGSDGGKVLYDKLGLTLTSGPLARVDIKAEYAWTQQARGNVDLTNYLLSNWPGAINGAIIGLSASNWPSNGASLGDGWQVARSSAQDLRDFTVHTKTSGSTSIVKWPDGDGTQTNFSETLSYLGAPTTADAGSIVTSDKISVTNAKDGDGIPYVSSYNRSFSESRTAIGVQEINITLVAGYNAARPCTELVSMTLFADVQPILTDPDDE